MTRGGTPINGSVTSQTWTKRHDRTAAGSSRISPATERQQPRPHLLYKAAQSLALLSASPRVNVPRAQRQRGSRASYSVGNKSWSAGSPRDIPAPIRHLHAGKQGWCRQALTVLAGFPCAAAGADAARRVREAYSANAQRSGADTRPPWRGTLSDCC